MKYYLKEDINRESGEPQGTKFKGFITTDKGVIITVILEDGRQLKALAGGVIVKNEIRKADLNNPHKDMSFGSTYSATIVLREQSMRDKEPKLVASIYVRKVDEAELILEYL